MNSTERQKPPQTPVPAATLILVRQNGAAPEVYLLRRSRSAGFMAGNFVFPGGLVDEHDLDPALCREHADLALEAQRQRLGAWHGRLQPQDFAVAGIRETFEEAGVLLASRPRGAAGALAALESARREAGLARGWLAGLLKEDGWLLQLSALRRWSHWITPALMPRRFDTRFFVAAAPAGQQCRPDGHETTEGCWISPRRALEENLAGRIPLSPPTLVTLQELLAYPDLETLERALETRDWGAAVFPRLVPLGKENGAVLLEPWDPLYDQEQPGIDPAALPAALLPAGEKFSRLWNGDGIWRPVKALS